MCTELQTVYFFETIDPFIFCVVKTLSNNRQQYILFYQPIHIIFTVYEFFLYLFFEPLIIIVTIII